MKDEMLYRYLYGETTRAENEQILTWLDADPQNRIAELNRMHYVCSAVDHFSPRHATTVKIARSKSLQRIIRHVAAVAASVVVLMGAWHLGNRNTYLEVSSRITALEVPAGQHLKIQLEDGTKVWLNAGSKLEYPAVFEKKIRNVRICGEALFEVKHDAHRPFVVETFTSKIEVLGTRFNVFADKQRNRFSTTLVEGHVKVTSLRNPSETFYMEPYDVVSLVGGSLYKTHTSDFKDLCWTEGLIHIRKMPFDDLMARFEKAYGVKIVFERTDLPRIEVLSGEIRVSDGIDYALHVLQQVSDFTYERDEKNNVIIIR